MAITFTLVSKGSNHLVYLAASSGSQNPVDAGTLQMTGAGAADVALEDAAVPDSGANYNAGLLKEVVDIDFPVGPNMSGVARRQMMDWGLGGPPSQFACIIKVPGKRCRPYIVPLLPGGGEVLKNWAIDDNNVGLGYAVACTAVGAARALVVIEAIGSPQQT